LHVYFVSDGGLALAADGVIQVTENSTSFVFTDTTPWMVRIFLYTRILGVHLELLPRIVS
jgi:hypothetical protein